MVLTREMRFDLPPRSRSRADIALMRPFSFFRGKTGVMSEQEPLGTCAWREGSSFAVFYFEKVAEEARSTKIDVCL